VIRWLIDVVRGALMGAAEVVPGVSGGTIALIVGIYRTLIEQAAHLVGALRMLVSSEARQGQGVFPAFWGEIRAARWSVLLPVGLGMVAAVFVGASLLEPLIEDYPVETRAVFSGLVLAGIIVPASMVTRTKDGPWRGKDVLVAVLAAAFAFVITGIPPGNIEDPSPLVIMLSAAIAVCALVLPGLSGSFILLTIGLYETTLNAVNERDWAYLATFAVGAAIGLATFVSVLQWLFEHRPRPTLVVLTGLMAGSLRALWPWQTDDRELLAPSGDVGQVVLLFLAGAASVLVLLWLEKRFRHRLTDEEVEEDGNAEPAQQ
jgi:putative membrane protein